MKREPRTTPELLAYSRRVLYACAQFSAFNIAIHLTVGYATESRAGKALCLMAAAAWAMVLWNQWGILRDGGLDPWTDFRWWLGAKLDRVGAHRAASRIFPEPPKPPKPKVVPVDHPRLH